MRPASARPLGAGLHDQGTTIARVVNGAEGEWVVLADGEVAGRREAAGYHAIDVSDGSVRQVPRHTVGWCEVSYRFRDRSSYADGRRRASGHRPCSVDG